jgi:glycosyltransferase involved in cell wall biosynthesis
MDKINNKNPKIAFFLPSLRGGGAEWNILKLANYLADKDFDVDLILCKAVGSYLDRVNSNVRVVDLNASRVLLSLPKLVRYLRKETPYALVSALNHANAVALMARLFSFRSTSITVTIRNSLPEDGQIPSQRAYLYFIKQTYFLANHVVAVSQGVADSFSRTTNFPLDRIKVIYNPVVYPEMFELAAHPVNHEWFANADPPVILAAGRLVEHKDFETLIQAFKLVLDKYDSRLVILGEGKERSHLEALIKDLGLSKYVSLPGFVQNPYAYMSRSAVFVLSSRREGLPTVLIEALALGIPVVSTNCRSGPEEILDNGEFGYLVEVHNPESMADAILSTLKKPMSKNKLMNRGKQFTLEKSVFGYEEIITGNHTNN